jgi:diguanylate cyclase
MSSSQVALKVQPAELAPGARPMIADERRSAEIARAAINNIKKWRLPATPSFFELCFLYAGGEKPSLIQAVREILSKSETLTKKDAEALYIRFIGGGDIAERIGSVGLSLDGQVSQVCDAIDSAVYATSTHQSDVAKVRGSLQAARKGDELKFIAGQLAQAIGTFKQINYELEGRLKSSKQDIEQLQKNLKAIRLEAQTDALTGLTNRRAFDRLLASTLEGFKKSHEPLAFIMCDVDHFRKFNNKWGHLVGDQVLRLVGQVLHASFKGQDIVARYGGEEFAIVLPNTTLVDACTVAEQVRRKVMSSHLRNRNTGVDMGQVTLSMGVAAAGQSDTPEWLIARADGCLYSAKQRGRNRIVCEADRQTV